MSNNSDDKPSYIFCSAETKAELVKRSGADTPAVRWRIKHDIRR